MPASPLSLVLTDLQQHGQAVHWQHQYQVEQDLLLSLAMIAIFNDKFLAGQVAMRGGTVLHKVHLAPASRYSEDIDLVVVGDRAEGHIHAALKRVLTPLFGKYKRDWWASVKLTVRNASLPSRILRLEYEIPSIALPGRTLKLKVEANVSERTPFRPVKRVPFALAFRGDMLSTDIVSYDIDEMLGTKMRALFQREQGRDLFDLYWALTQPAAMNPSISGVIEAFQHYMAGENAVVTRQDFLDALDFRLASAGFRSDMAALLRAGLVYDVDQAGMFVRSNLLNMLP